MSRKNLFLHRLWGRCACYLPFQFITIAHLLGRAVILLISMKKVPLTKADDLPGNEVLFKIRRFHMSASLFFYSFAARLYVIQKAEVWSWHVLHPHIWVTAGPTVALSAILVLLWYECETYKSSKCERRVLESQFRTMLGRWHNSAGVFPVQWDRMGHAQNNRFNIPTWGYIPFTDYSTEFWCEIYCISSKGKYPPEVALPTQYRTPFPIVLGSVWACRGLSSHVNISARPSFRTLTAQGTRYVGDDLF